MTTDSLLRRGHYSIRDLLAACVSCEALVSVGDAAADDAVATTAEMLGEALADIPPGSPYRDDLNATEAALVEFADRLRIYREAKDALDAASNALAGIAAICDAQAPTRSIYEVLLEIRAFGISQPVRTVVRVSTANGDGVAIERAISWALNLFAPVGSAVESASAEEIVCEEHEVHVVDLT